MRYWHVPLKFIESKMYLKWKFHLCKSDETTDATVQNHLVVRYIHHCEVVKIFWGFFQLKKVNAEGIAEVILTKLVTIWQGDKT